MQAPKSVRYLAFALGFCLSVYGASNASFAQRTLRVMTYNIHHGEGVDGKLDLLRIAELIKREKADIVALQEVDRGVERTARRDLIKELAELTKMNYAFGKNIAHQGGDYGNAVLTRFPVVKEQNLHYTMLRGGEQRGLLQVVLKVNGKELLLLNTHLDFRPNDEERQLNAEELKKALGLYAGLPVILCGDFNGAPGSFVHQKMKETFADVWESAGKGDGFTISSTRPNKRIDYIFFGKDRSIEPLKAYVIQSEASDHLPMVAEFRFR